MMFQLEQDLKDIDMINFKNTEVNAYKKVLLEINRLIIDLILKNEIPYNFQYLNAKIKTLRLCNSNLLEADDENNIIQICQYNQLGEKLTDEDEVIHLIHEYLHIVSFRNCEDINDIGNLYYGFDEFCTEYITSIICMKIGLNYEIYYRNHSAGYIDKRDYEFMKNLSAAIDLKTLLKLYFIGNRDLLEQSLGIDLLLSMNEYLDYYLEIYDSFNKPRKVVNEILNKSVFDPQKQVLNNYVTKINIYINKLFSAKEHISGPIKR